MFCRSGVSGYDPMDFSMPAFLFFTISWSWLKLHLILCSLLLLLPFVFPIISLFRWLQLVVMKFSFDIFQASSSLVEKFPFADVEGQGAENMESRKRDRALHTVRLTHVDTTVASEGLLQEPTEATTVRMKQTLCNCSHSRLRRWPVARP